MVRLEGSVVAPLAMTMIGDWMLETAESMETIIRRELGLAGPNGTEDMQVVPSGPGEGGDGLLQMLLAAINSARQEWFSRLPISCRTIPCCGPCGARRAGAWR